MHVSGRATSLLAATCSARDVALVAELADRRGSRLRATPRRRRLRRPSSRTRSLQQTDRRPSSTRPRCAHGADDRRVHAARCDVSPDGSRFLEYDAPGDAGARDWRSTAATPARSTSSIGTYDARPASDRAAQPFLAASDLVADGDLTLIGRRSHTSARAPCTCATTSRGWAARSGPDAHPLSHAAGWSRTSPGSDYDGHPDDALDGEAAAAGPPPGLRRRRRRSRPWRRKQPVYHPADRADMDSG